MNINFIKPLTHTELKKVKLWFIGTIGLLAALAIPAIVYTSILVHSCVSTKKQHKELLKQTASFDAIMKEKNSYVKQTKTESMSSEKRNQRKAILVKIQNQLDLLNSIYLKGIQLQSVTLLEQKTELSCIVPTPEYALILLETLNKDGHLGKLYIASIIKNGNQFQVTMQQQKTNTESITANTPQKPA